MTCGKRNLRLFGVITAFVAIAGAVLLTGSLSAAAFDEARTDANSALSYTQSELQEFSGNGPLVIELFTSVNCPFCPQADKLLRGLVDQAGVMGLTCHVDYYDMKDNPLSLEFCSERQNAYIANIDGASLYTPQMIVNGKAGAIGRKPAELMQVVRDQKSTEIARIEVIHLAGQISPASGPFYSGGEDNSQNPLLSPLTASPVPISPDNRAGAIRIDLPITEQADGIEELWFVWYKHHVHAENSTQLDGQPDGHDELTYRNVVVKAEKRPMKAAGQSIVIPDAYTGPGFGMMVLGQSAEGVVKAAGQINWPARQEFN